MERGYTLLELCFVIVIIATLLMVVAPRLTPFLTGTRLDSSARHLATFCRYLNSQSALTKTYMALHMEIETGEYWVTAYAPSDGGGPFQQREAVEELEVTSDLLRRTKLHEGVRFEDVNLSETGKADSGTAVLDFTPVGPTQRMLVHLANDADSRLTVFFDPVTGTCGILEGYAESVAEQGVG